MFDKLIVSEPETANFRNRRNYFIASTVAVGLLFLTAVIISIYAADYHLGAGSFEITELVAPVEMAAPAPKEPEPVQRQMASTPVKKVAETTRQILQARTDQPTKVPETVSTVPNRYLSIPDGAFKVNGNDQNATPTFDRTATGDTGTLGSKGDGEGTIAKAEPLPEPPPVKKPDPPKPPPIKSLGVINGKAAYLPKPTYSAAAIAVHAKGQVSVQVLIDENGRVVSANAVSGHPLLRNAAEVAARNAKFTPTLLSNVPVKVTGVIIYNFNG